MRTGLSSPPRHLRSRGAVPKGCAFGLLLVGVIIGALTIFVWLRYDSLLADSYRQRFDHLVDAMELPDEEAAKVRVTLHRLPDALEEGDIDRDQFEMAMEKLHQSPEMRAALTKVLIHRHFQNTELSEEEQAEATRLINQYGHGLITGQIDPQRDEVLQRHFMVDPDDPGAGGRDHLSADELREVVATLRESIGDLDLPDERLDIVGPLNEAVSRAFAEVGVSEAPPPQQQPEEAVEADEPADEPEDGPADDVGEEEDNAEGNAADDDGGDDATD